MAETATALVMHEAPHQGSVDELAAAVRDRNSEIPLTKAYSYEDSKRALQDEGTEIVITRALPDELLAEAPAVRWIQALSAGVDHYDIERLRDRGIRLTNASGVHANPAAEQVLGYMLQFERNLRRGFRQQTRREWRHFGGGELADGTLGVIGVGEIGGRIAELGSAFEMTTLGLRQSPDRGHDAIDEMFGPDELHALLARSDYVALACPLTDGTHGLLSAREFESMPQHGVVLNVARGEIIDEPALIAALQKGTIGGAALDVQRREPLPADSPLWDLSNVIITPHMAGSTPNYLDRCADIFVSNYDRYVRGETDEFENQIV
ncbi:D-2-hydroxyacid dehydrogenase [Natrialba asiatica]|uniref:D-isomer specific 2-hydroxyacid dehydrogenase NAD-binding protein n=1 Tax=Natrialba asiatica (strain ATCC 700177 / DSM 12278 / JCM 9576 / FERM P-10747 / NBRC 102637 / 172P1) TaxID=29540 RepID=M0B8T3_NATA1|nr:D-2-hydroxyacid dehydrogenase [Natrialba asiatica]ELZ06029.1 D-isomer specific 2-hydroxyacid dehydrogenase NAD-binding protein [Natrialba asiatica DSM 12278]